MGDLTTRPPTLDEARDPKKAGIVLLHHFSEDNLLGVCVDTVLADLAAARERGRELEAENERLNQEMHGLHAEHERVVTRYEQHLAVAREGLEWYADQRKWLPSETIQIHGVPGSDGFITSDIAPPDAGPHIARTTLAKLPPASGFNVKLPFEGQPDMSQNTSGKGGGDGTA